MTSLEAEFVVKPLPNAIVIIAVVGGVLALGFILLGIIGQAYISSRPPDKAEQFRRDVEFWLGQNGVIFSMIVFFLLVALIVGIVVLTIHIPIWTEIFRRRISNLEGAALVLTGNVADVTKTIDNFVKMLPSLLDRYVSTLSGGLTGLRGLAGGQPPG